MPVPAGERQHDRGEGRQPDQRRARTAAGRRPSARRRHGRRRSGAACAACAAHAAVPDRAGPAPAPVPIRTVVALMAGLPVTRRRSSSSALDALERARRRRRGSDELLERRDHHGGREVGPGVAVEELGDRASPSRPTRPTSSAASCTATCRRSVLAEMNGSARCCWPVRRRPGWPGSRGTSWRRPRSSGSAAIRSRRSGASIASAPIAGSISGKLKKSTSSRSSSRELLEDEGAEQVHAGLLLLQRLRGLLPGAAERVGLVERQQLLPGVEDLLDLGVSHDSLPAIRSTWNW